MRAYLVHGLVAGLVAGFAAFAVAYVAGEPPVEQAIQIEEAASAAAGVEEEPGPVSREVQSTGGLLTATVGFGTALGGVVGVVAGLATGRLGRLRGPATAAVVTALGFVAWYLVPYVKYPPNPPAVGDPATMGVRAADYFSMLLVSVAAVVVAVLVARRLVARRGAWTGIVVPALGYLAVVVAAGLLFRTHQEVSDTFPAATLWQFRLASLLVQATLWGVLGVVLSGLLDRDARRARRGSDVELARA